MSVPESNYTQIPNAIISAMPRMSESELRVVMAVCRQTFGWRKKRDRISWSQLVVMTGMSRQGVKNGLDAATASGWILAFPVGQSFEYEINVVEEPVNEVDRSGKATSQRSRPALVNEVDQFSQKLVNEVDTQKKTEKEKERKGDAANADAPPSEPAQPKRDPVADMFNRATSKSEQAKVISLWKGDQDAKAVCVLVAESAGLDVCASDSGKWLKGAKHLCELNPTRAELLAIWNSASQRDREFLTHPMQFVERVRAYRASKPRSQREPREIPVSQLRPVPGFNPYGGDL